MVTSDGQSRVIEAIEQKTQKAIQLYESLTKAVNKPYSHHIKEFNQSVNLPRFL